MTSFRAKPSSQIRADALEMARRKALAGCNPCVDAYLDLARRHGASEDEIRAALQHTENESVSAQGR